MNWKLLGNCTGEDPDLFFPTYDDRESSARNIQEEMAKGVCSGCPVSGECLDDALRNHEHGVWGGTSWEDRRSLARRGTRVNCIRCGGRDHARTEAGQVCLRCGLSWLI